MVGREGRRHEHRTGEEKRKEEEGEERGREREIGTKQSHFILKLNTPYILAVVSRGRFSVARLGDGWRSHGGGFFRHVLQPVPDVVKGRPGITGKEGQKKPGRFSGPHYKKAEWKNCARQGEGP